MIEGGGGGGSRNIDSGVVRGDTDTDTDREEKMDKNGNSAAIQPDTLNCPSLFPYDIHNICTSGLTVVIFAADIHKRVEQCPHVGRIAEWWYGQCARAMCTDWAKCNTGRVITGRWGGDEISCDVLMMRLAATC